MHTHEEFADERASYSAKFLVPEVFKHKYDDVYEVCVEGVRKIDSFIISSGRKKVLPPSIEMCTFFP